MCVVSVTEKRVRPLGQDPNWRCANDDNSHSRFQLASLMAKLGSIWVFFLVCLKCKICFQVDLRTGDNDFIHKG